MRPTVEQLTGRPHLSYSSLDTFTQCGEKFRLSRIHRMPEEQSWWLVGGSAFHKATEVLDLNPTSTDYEALFGMAWDEEVAKLDLKQPVRAGGRATKEFPNKEDDKWWLAQGPRMVQQYHQWRQDTGWHLYDMAGTPAVEWQFTLTLPNPIAAPDASPELVVLGYIDRVFVTPDGEVIVVDLKTGSKEPASTTQLGVYAAALRQRGGVTPLLGAYYMARQGTVGQTKSLLHYTDSMLAYWLGTFEDAVRSERFLPHVSSLCGTCGVASHCYAIGGHAPYQTPFTGPAM